jgi:hypothetical protein
VLYLEVRPHRGGYRFQDETAPHGCSPTQSAGGATVPEKLPDKYTDPERYEQEQARRMRAVREEREAYDAARNAAWHAELGKPMASRQWFLSGDLLDELATNPQNLEVDAVLRRRIFKKLANVVWYRQFVDGEVATLSGEPPSFVSLPPPSRDKFIIFDEDLSFGAILSSASLR